MSATATRRPRAIDTTETDAPVITIERKAVTVDRDALWDAMNDLRHTLWNPNFFEDHDMEDADSLALIARNAATLAHLAGVLHADEVNRPERPVRPRPTIDVMQMVEALDITVTEWDETAPTLPFSGQDLERFIEVLRESVQGVDLRCGDTFTRERTDAYFKLATRAEALASAAHAMRQYTAERTVGMTDLQAVAHMISKGLIVAGERRAPDRPLQGQTAAEATDDDPSAARPE